MRREGSNARVYRDPGGVPHPGGNLVRAARAGTPQTLVGPDNFFERVDVDFAFGEEHGMLAGPLGGAPVEITLFDPGATR